MIREPEDLLKSHVIETNGKGFAIALGCATAKPFFFSGSKGTLDMSNTTQPQNLLSATPSTNEPSFAPPQQPAIIATRQRCDADGVGLSHYILMDRKPAK